MAGKTSDSTKKHNKMGKRKKKMGNRTESKKEPKPDAKPIGILQKLKTQAENRMSISSSDTNDVGDQLIRVKSALLPQSSTLEADLPEWYEEMTEDNVLAFKDLFEMLDSSKTGILNANNLYEGMKRIDPDITREEVEQVLKKLDKDGNGEIDFDEFLYHMTQGEFPEGSEEEGAPGEKKRKSKFSRRQRLFYTAITQYSLKNSLGVSFGANLRQPHVISHYTAGVRLIGLTDRQLERQMKKMQKSARNNTSPYAKPLPFAYLGSGAAPMHRPGQIGKKDVSSKYQLRETSSNRPWKPSPSPEVKEPEKEPEEPPRATIALDEFYKNMQKETVRHSYEHWEKLYADTIRPKKLMNNFLSVYRAYSPHKQEEAFVVCPWIPGPYRHFRRATAQINQSPSPFGSYSNFSSARYDNTVVRDGRKSECEVRSLSSFM
ncbi:hypothetical protein FSP39_024396 [Pinctada imbricata]|uniref:EF-hand domain-containing protein n=1 Tax=Pinctada imbricata TaxID=66713 RepID=A0AA89BQU6_PINIB|nr:hypothetical protein FSP39_024396 [Pinctada imbricata]